MSKAVIKRGAFPGQYRVIVDGFLLGIVKRHKSGLRLGGTTWTARNAYGLLVAHGEVRKFSTRRDAIKALLS